MAADTALQKFSWDIDAAPGAFWASEPFTNLSKFFANIMTSDEIATMTTSLDADVDAHHKLLQLLPIAQAELAKYPDTLDTVPASGFKALHERHALVAQIEDQLGDYEPAHAAAAEQRMRGMIASWARRTDRPFPHDLGTMNNLCWLLLRRGKLAEGERMTRELILLEEVHPKLGIDSPQVLGARRMLMEALGRQGRYDEAKRMYEEAYKLISLVMPKGKFAKYEQEEIEAMDEVRDNLEKWKTVAVA